MWSLPCGADKDIALSLSDVMLQLVLSVYCQTIKIYHLWLYSLVLSDVVGNPEDRFSHNEVHILNRFHYYTFVFSFVNLIISIRSLSYESKF